MFLLGAVGLPLSMLVLLAMFPCCGFRSVLVAYILVMEKKSIKINKKNIYVALSDLHPAPVLIVPFVECVTAHRSTR